VEDRQHARERRRRHKKLAEGVRLVILHPEVAYRDCTDCEAFVYDEKTGKKLERQGKPVPRPRGTKAPCRLRENGCPKGTPENSRTLTDDNWQAYQHYSECRAVGQFPDDPIVRRNAAIIREAADSAERELALRIAGPIGALLGGGR
jgi:hypothetical protein